MVPRTPGMPTRLAAVGYSDMSGHLNRAQGKARTALRQVKQIQYVLFRKVGNPPSLPDLGRAAEKSSSSECRFPLSPFCSLSAFGALRLSLLRSSRPSFGALHPTSPGALHPALFGALHLFSLVWCIVPRFIRCIAPLSWLGALHLLLRLVQCTSPSSSVPCTFLRHWVRCTAGCFVTHCVNPSASSVVTQLRHVPPSIGAVRPNTGDRRSASKRRLGTLCLLFSCLLLGICSNGCPLLVAFSPPSALC